MKRDEKPSTVELPLPPWDGSGFGTGYLSDDIDQSIQSVGRYILRRPVGNGGMGIVYEGYDPNADRPVALKFIRVDKGKNNTARLRLVREGRALAALNHLNVVRVYDMGRYGENQVFVAMEFLKGKTLLEWMRGGEHDWKECVEVFLEAGEGLAAAHACGIIHRDFKPENVIITGAGEVKVLDFGLAYMEEVDPNSAQENDSSDLPELRPSEPVLISLTAPGYTLGTPHYMSPEQTLGIRATEKSDQYSFCVALYEALYGHRPYAGENVKILFENIRKGEIPKERGDAGVPDYVRKILLKGLAVHPDDRYSSMRELLGALRKALISSRRRSCRKLLLLGSLTATVAVNALPSFANFPSDTVEIPSYVDSGVDVDIAGVIANLPPGNPLKAYFTGFSGAEAQVRQKNGDPVLTHLALACLAEQRRVLEEAIRESENDVNIPDPQKCIPKPSKDVSVHDE